MPCPTNWRMTENPSASTDRWTAAEMSDSRFPSRTCSRPLQNDRRAAVDEPHGLVPRPAGRHGQGRVAVEALVEDAEVQADDVSLLEDPPRGDAVDDLLVDRDADRGRVAAVALEGRDGPELPRPLLGVDVEVAGPDPRPDEGPELGQDAGRDPARLPHELEFRGGLADDHGRSCVPFVRLISAVEDVPDGPEGLLDRAVALDAVEDALRLIMGDEGLRLGVVGPHPLLDDVGAVVGPLDEAGAADVADALAGRLPGDDVEDRPAGGADPPRGQAPDDDVLPGLDEEDDLGPAAVELLDAQGLGEVPGIAVEGVALPAVRGRQALLEELEDDGVVDEPALAHLGRGLLAERRLLLDGAAQEVPGGDLGEAVGGLDEVAHGPLAAAGRAEEDDSHPRLPRIRLRRMKPS